MASPESKLDPPRPESPLPSSLWGGPFMVGLLLSLLGIVALGAVVLTSLASAIFFGSMLVVAGVFEIIHAFRIRRGQGPFLLFLLGGILSVAVGLISLLRPEAALFSLTLLLSGYFCVNGLFRSITSVSDRHPGWGWDFTFGLVSLGLGVIIFALLPFSSLWALGLVVGVEILVRGSAIMAGALRARQLLRQRFPL